jgi:hypothetical protein
MTSFGKGISRIDSGSTHGWFVRGYKNGHTFPKLYSDRKCGGTDKALELARIYRDKLHTELAKIEGEMLPPKESEASHA